ncbi:hypothetical protein FKW77_001093 [Venturia effusa]|uniref:Zn(2)-C6 fungal-type domain-containing protein n=1 Tax=Venturia effusa TaxID=50376 RepID=A0A517LPM5_9PEZI|nr:hypothetical protein FKW77_001093 [Venturia effusa]
MTPLVDRDFFFLVPPTVDRGFNKMAITTGPPPDIYKPQHPPHSEPGASTPMGERFRVTSSCHQSRRVTRQSAMPLRFDDKHLKKLLDHYCTAERLSSWVQSASVIALLKYWVKSTLQCPEHNDIYRSLLLPAESEEKWSDFKEDCVHVAYTRIKGEDVGEPAPDPPTSAWAYAIEQLVRDSWKDVASGPLNGGQKPGQSRLNPWPCERACDLLHTVFEDLRREPSSGYFANTLGVFTGQRHFPVPEQLRFQSTPKPACETCHFNHIACDRAEPVCGQCKLSNVLCTKTSKGFETSTDDDGDPSHHDFDYLFEESPPRSEPLLELVSRLEPPMAVRPRSEHSSVQPSLSKTTAPTPLLTTPACRTCRLKHRGCDRARPSCGECSLRSVDCVWDRDGAKRNVSAESLRPSTNSTKPPGNDTYALEEGEIEEDISVDKPQAPQSSGFKRALEGGSALLPPTKRHLAGRNTLYSAGRNTLYPDGSNILYSAGINTLADGFRPRVPGAIATQPVSRAPIAPMIAAPTTPAMRPSSLGKVHSDRVAQIGQASPEQPAAPVPPARTGSNSVQLSSARVDPIGIKAETNLRLMSDHFTQTQTRSVPPQLSTPVPSAVQMGVKLSKKQRKQLANGSNRPNATLASTVRTPVPSFEQIRLSNTLQYCKTLFDDILAGRNASKAAQMGVTAIQHALGNN